MEVICLIGILAFVLMFILASVLAFITGLVGLFDNYGDNGVDWIIKVFVVLLGICGICLFSVLGWQAIIQYQNSTLL